MVSPRAAESKRRLRNYSLGMRQRLGIAHALLGDPSVLILDEPANGLDPAGIRWMRGLLKGYADRGGTVLLSSHLLNEVELIADEMILIGRGRIVAQGDKRSLLAEAPTSPLVTFGRQRQALARAHLGERGLQTQPVADGLRVQAEAVEVGSVAADHGIVLTELRSGARWPRGPLPRAHVRHPARRPPPVRAQEADDQSCPEPHRDPDPRRVRHPAGSRSAAWSAVELRKMADTRAGLWLLIAIGAGHRRDHDDLLLGRRPERPGLPATSSASPATPQGFLLPVLGILLITSEWGQRTALVTFTLVPLALAGRRGQGVGGVGRSAWRVDDRRCADRGARHAGRRRWTAVRSTGRSTQPGLSRFGLLLVSGILQGLAYRPDPAQHRGRDRHLLRAADRARRSSLGIWSRRSATSRRGSTSARRSRRCSTATTQTSPASSGPRSPRRP